MGFPASIDELGSFAAKLDRLQRVDQPLVPDRTHQYPSVLDRFEVEHIRNFHTVIRAFTVRRR